MNMHISYPDLNIKNYPDSSSSCNQESFVLNVLKEKTNGFFLEIGSGHPEISNNTNLLENKFNWRGLALDTDENLVNLYNQKRKSTCLKQNALNFNYTDYFVNNDFPKQIDYLQIDVDDTPRNANLLALIQLPLQDYRFSVITIEHDFVRDYTLEKMRDVQRFILSSLDYELVINGDSEDFWVDKRNVPQENYWCLYSIGSFHPGYSR
jgi:hypothetical protein